MEYRNSTQIINNFVDYLSSLKTNVTGFSNQFAKIDEPELQIKKSTLQDIMEDFNDCINQSIQTIKSIQVENINLKEKLSLLEQQATQRSNPTEEAEYLNPFSDSNNAMKSTGLDVIMETNEDETDKNSRDEGLTESQTEQVTSIKQGLRHKIFKKKEELEEPTEEPKKYVIEEPKNGDYDRMMRFIIEKMIGLSHGAKDKLGNLFGNGSFETFFNKLLGSQYYLFEVEDIKKALEEMDNQEEERKITGDQTKRKRGGQRDQVREKTEQYVDPLDFQNILRSYGSRSIPRKSRERVLSPGAERFKTNYF